MTLGCSTLTSKNDCVDAQMAIQEAAMHMRTLEKTN